jgi:hypothetical protein
MDIPAGCSTHVFTNPHEGFLAVLVLLTPVSRATTLSLALMAQVQASG